jgi:hypothetical protein
MSVERILEKGWRARLYRLKSSASTPRAWFRETRSNEQVAPSAHFVPWNQSWL